MRRKSSASVEIQAFGWNARQKRFQIFISASQKADIALPSQRFSILQNANPIIKNTYLIIILYFGQAG